MKITKFGHCCLLIEEQGVRILTDPGTFTTQQDSLTNIDFVLITHEHADHFHVPSVKAILQNNPQAQIITNAAVGALLTKEGIAFKVVGHGQSADVNGVTIEGYGQKHALIHSSLVPVENTGYFVGSRFFYPGDAFTNPGKPVEILALPVAGPWMRIAEAIDYALALKPKICFPVHEAILKAPGMTHVVPGKILEPQGITYKVLEIDQETEF
jgi:L-ascorbate metabolism protein UlaG (beta-lactamase superfamily)